MNEILVAPSILSADFGNLASDVVTAERAGADWIHVDVMDGHFVPNITIGPDVTRAVRRSTVLPLDVHLMIELPEKRVPDFIDAGADRITVHQETCPHLHRVVEEIRSAGASPGVAVNPATPVGTLREIVPYIDLILIMTVNPGFGGQAFIPTSPAKIREAKVLVESAGRLGEVEIQVDGGIDPMTTQPAVRAGATVLVAGSAVFGAEGGPERTIPALREAAASAHMSAA